MPDGKTILGAFVQTRPKFGKNEENITQAIKLASKVKADLYVFPELCNTGYAFVSKEEARLLSEPFSTGKSVESLCAFSEKRNCSVVAGLAENDKDLTYNSSVIIEKGKVLGSYRKTHLFYREKLWFSPGDTGLRVFGLESLDCKIGVMICFDWFFPEAARELAIKGSEIICHPSNLVLPGKAQQGMLTRAFENRVFSITANRVGIENRGPKDKFKFTGKSQIVSPLMERLCTAKSNKSIAKAAKLDLQFARNKQVTSMNGVFADRRLEFYPKQYEQLTATLI
ncbi:MAG TPA: nitrilase-related carbon-nitrogen hydrolase [Nitrososphaerales archaeon]|nr:nitrilase-related carbon-nitrogen hydrolase [Nitrososphaerales archaeon]